VISGELEGAGIADNIMVLLHRRAIDAYRNVTALFPRLSDALGRDL
jgi:hypothetical protein